MQDKTQGQSTARAFGESYLGRLQRMDNGSSVPLTGETLRDWKPRGILVAHLHEHHGTAVTNVPMTHSFTTPNTDSNVRTGPVNQVKATRDNLFFASCSDDGTVKIWDCQRLTNQKNVTNRSRLTYSSQGIVPRHCPSDAIVLLRCVMLTARSWALAAGGKIKCITVCENSHAIASGSDNSSIHVIKVEYTTKKEGQVNRYTGVSTVQYLDKVQGPIVAIDHFNADSQSVLVYATGTAAPCTSMCIIGDWS
jgi:phosphoinositide-3-kinase regulatory subunit 4